jgi:hypothetical protein
VAALGTIATGAVALASPHNATAAGAIALGTAALYNGVDIYTRNFLFNTDNIESVRVMIMGALAAHASKALPENDPTIWTFAGAAQVINEHQAICLPASIRSLVLEAIKGRQVCSGCLQLAKAAPVRHQRRPPQLMLRPQRYPRLP